MRRSLAAAFIVSWGLNRWCLVASELGSFGSTLVSIAMMLDGVLTALDCADTALAATVLDGTALDWV